MEIVFGTGNKHKLQEVQALMPEDIQLLSLSDIDFTLPLPETHDTIDENAIEKVSFLYHQIHRACFAEDTGLVVPALDGEPGVYSARYAGVPSNDVNNYHKLLSRMAVIQDRYAYFKTVIAFIDATGSLSTFEGILEGEIANIPKGNNGFGYDPVFLMPDSRTLAEYNLTEKLKCSHRSKALKKFLIHINENLLCNRDTFPHNLLKNHAT